MFGFITKYRKEITALIKVVEFAVTKAIAFIQEVAAYASAEMKETAWAF